MSRARRQERSERRRRHSEGHPIRASLQFAALFTLLFGLLERPRGSTAAVLAFVLWVFGSAGALMYVLLIRQRRRS